MKCIPSTPHLYQSVELMTILKRIIQSLLVLLLILNIFQAQLISNAGVIVEFFKVDGQDQSVLVQWKTNTEISISGYYIQRSLSMDTGYSRVGNFINSQGISPSGATYEYVDQNLVNGTTYWYKLEIIDDEGGSTFYITAKSAIPNTQTTLVPTRESNTPTQNPQISITPGAINTPIPTLTTLPAYPSPATSTVFPNYAPTTPVVDQAEVTATLIPLPSLTYNYPPTEQPEQTELPEEDTSISVNESADQSWSSIISSQTAVIIGLVLIWLVFGILVIYFVRRLR